MFGWVFAAHQLGAALAAWGAGEMRDVLGSYQPAFVVAGIACLGAALAVLQIRRPDVVSATASPTTDLAPVAAPS